ncbi:hypothetical protein RvVAR0630_pl09100 (plasmid) [Agrobacterium vitis]|nr:hypothetical protein RvVAR0630_pl09100 [Agrobacterium vitis]
MDEIDVLSTEVNVALTRLESSVITLKQVTTDVAHDLKTPIARTFLILEDSLQSDVPGDMKNGIEIALVELKSTAETFDAVLRIAQIESRSRTTNFRVFNLKSLVRDIYEVYEAIAVDAGYDLTLANSISDAWIDGDPDLVKQLLANLLANAMRHTPAGSKIVLSLSNNDNTIYLSISDNGPGIPREEHERVFDRFYRLEKSRTTAGSGLGLTLVKAIVGLHGANINLLDNDPGLSVVVGFPQVKTEAQQAH